MSELRTIPKTDSIVDSIIDRFVERAQVGMKKIWNQFRSY
jgi:hypothetical protein